MSDPPCFLPVFFSDSFLTAPPPSSLECWNVSSFIPDLSSPLPLSVCLSQGDLIKSHNLQFLYAHNF